MRFRVRKIVAASAISAMALSTASRAEEFKLADFLPPQHPFQEKVYEALASKIETATGGEITITVYPGGALGANPIEQYDRVQNGVAEIAFSLPGYTASKFPMTLLSELPGVVEEATATQKLWDNIDHILDEHKRVHLLSLWTNGENVLYTRDKPVRSLADVQGMNIRVPSRNAGLVVESWGAVPVSMPLPEIYNALQTGVIDGVLIDSTATFAFRLGEVADYVTTGMNATVSPMVLFMNRDAYQGLSDAHREAFDQIGREMSFTANKVQLAATGKGLAMFREMDGKEWIELSPEAAAEFDAASAVVVENSVKAAEADGLAAQAYIDALKE